MTIYVGEHIKAGSVNFYPLFSDVDDHELHAFAKSIEIERRKHRPKERGLWSHYRINGYEAAAAFRAGASKADRIKLVECSCGPKAAKALAKKLAAETAKEGSS